MAKGCRAAAHGAAIAAMAANLVACMGAIRSSDDTRDSDRDGNDSNSPPDLPPSPVGGPEDMLPPAAGPSFACSAEAVPTGGPLRRLSRRQHENTLRDLMTDALGAADGDRLFAAAASYLAGLPDDQMPSLGHGAEGPSYRRVDQQVLDGHVQAAYDLTLTIARSAVEGARLGKLLGACATDGKSDNDSACLRDFIASFGGRALRGPLSDQDIAFYEKFAREPGGPVSATNVAQVLAGLLMAPRFLYQVEAGEAPVGGAEEQVDLTAYELAARLSYQFWDTLPDGSLWQAARDGSLLNPDTFSDQLQRIVSDPRTRTTMRLFYREWLDLDEVPKLDLHKNSARFRAFAGEQMPSETLHEQMADELADMVDHYTWTAPADVHELLRTNASFVRSEELAKLYVGPRWDGASDPPEFGFGERPGLLTRGARLVNSSGATRPIMRGVFVRRVLLCDQLPAPPPGANDNLPMLEPGLSGRQVVESITESSPGCAGCHKSYLNPIGFMLEGYDGLGRKRDVERVLDEGGKEIAIHEIDDRAVPQIVEDDLTPGQGALELSELIEKSGKLPACMARQYFRFSMGRREDDERDGCMLERLRRHFATESLQAGLRAIATDPAFWRRSFPRDDTTGESR